MFYKKFTIITNYRKSSEFVDHAKVLGVIISNTLQWNHHVAEVVKKANKCLYFLVLLKRANVPFADIISFYRTCIRPILKYCAPVFHHGLPAYLSDDLENIQRRTLSIISPGASYCHNLELFNVGILKNRRREFCTKLFYSVVHNTDHKLYHLLPLKYVPRYNLRRQRLFNPPICRTNRYKNTFIPAMICKQFITNFFYFIFFLKKFLGFPYYFINLSLM